MFTHIVYVSAVTEKEKERKKRKMCIYHEAVKPIITIAACTHIWFSPHYL